MRIFVGMFFVALLLAGCSVTPDAPPRDPILSQLEPGEKLALRMPATLMHRHDMTEPSYDAPEGYRPIPSYRGELLLLDTRLLFVETGRPGANSWLSIPYEAIARIRPSRTPLLHYVVVWDAKGHPDSFVVSARDVQALQRQMAEAMAARGHGLGRGVNE